MSIRDLVDPENRRGIGQRQQTPCSLCPQRPHCIPGDLDGQALTAFEREVVHLPMVPAGGILVEVGTPFDAPYAIKRGVLKSCYQDATGNEQIAAFHGPGAVLALPGWAGEPWTFTSVAVTDTWACQIPLRGLGATLRQRLLRLVSAGWREQYEFQLALAERDASQRLAAFLLRFADTLLLPRLYWPMAEAEIADYLGLDERTLRCSLREMLACGWISRHSHAIEIRDRSGLRRFAEG